MDSLRRKDGCSLRLCLPPYTGLPRLVLERGICENSRFQSRGLSDSHNKLEQAISEHDMHTLLATTPLIEILSFWDRSPTQLGRIKFTILQISQNRNRHNCVCTFMAPNRNNHRANLTKSHSAELFAHFHGADQKKGWLLTASVPTILYRASSFVFQTRHL